MLPEDVKAAEVRILERLEHEPSSAELHAELGEILVRQERIEEGAQALRKAMLLNEQWWADGCQLLQRMGQLVTAEFKKFDQHRALNRRFTGPPYLEVLKGLHEDLQPKTYVEIGVHTGGSLTLALPSTVAVGIDPAPVVKEKLTDRTRIFELTSDDFFAQHDLAEVLGAPTFDLAFIDGLHLWEQVLKDFYNLERFSRPDSVIALHDCMPLDDITSQRVRDSIFYTGDVWKLAACLKMERPDLKMAMIGAAPTGLCLVTGLNSADMRLREKYSELYDRWTPLSFSALKAHPEWMPASIENSREAVKEFVGLEA